MLLVILLVGGAILASGVIALALWPRILEWAVDSVVPAIDRILPALGEIARLALKRLDTLAVTVRQRVRDAWQELKKYLRAETVEIRKLSANRWLVEVTTWVIEKLGDQKARKIVNTWEETHDSVPQDLREAYIQTGATTKTVDARATRDREIAEWVAD